jgi:hypothetical protein
MLIVFIVCTRLIYVTQIFDDTRNIIYNSYSSGCYFSNINILYGLIKITVNNLNGKKVLVIILHINFYLNAVICIKYSSTIKDYRMVLNRL